MTAGTTYSEKAIPTRRVKCGIAATVTAQAQQDGYDVTLYAVRQWAAQGLLRVTYAGRKKLINYQSLLEHMEGTGETRAKFRKIYLNRSRIAHVRCFRSCFLRLEKFGFQGKRRPRRYPRPSSAQTITHTTSLLFPPSPLAAPPTTDN